MFEQPTIITRTSDIKENDDQNNQQQSQLTTDFLISTGRSLLEIVGISLRDFFLKAKIVRCLSSIILLKTAAMWLGFALDFILTIVFIPFSHSSMETNFKLFGWMCAMVPSIVHFSAHYFWFLTQLAFHCYREDEISERESPDIPKQKHVSLIFIDQWIGYVRAIISVGFLVLMLFQPWDDPFNIIFVPFGRLALYLINVGHICHLIGVSVFLLRHSILGCNDQTDHITDDDHDVHEEENELNVFWCISMIIAFASIDYVSPQDLEVMVYGILFISYRFFFMKFWIIPDHDTNVGTNQSTQRFLYTYDGTKRWFAIFSKSSKTTAENEQFYTYKLFIMIILRLLLTSMSFIVTDTRYSWFRIIYGLFYMIFCLFWLPPVFNTVINNNIIIWQMRMIYILLISMFGMLIGGILFVISNYNIHRMNGLYCLACPFIYSVVMLAYHLYHSVQNLPIKEYFRSGAILLQEKHDQINIVIHTYNWMYLFFIFIAFSGIAFSNSLYVQQATARQIQMDRYENKSGTFLIDENLDQYHLEACHWQYESFNIVDMMLFASLSYMPTDRIKGEIDTFYKETNLSIEFDEDFSAFEEDGVGKVTYFTLTTPDTVLISIRGTHVGYEWLVDFDIWSESVVNQIMSVLFPWSRLYPDYLNKLIIEYMSMLERLVLEDKSTNLSKRFYVSQMIKTLEKISKKYPKQRSFILVGHSLGGGLAKLAGIGINRTNLIVSISGPGITYSHTKYDEIKFVTTESLNARIFNIIHDRDMVPWADKQEGLIQTITCPKHYTRIQCHAILPMFCNMLRNCGNPRKFMINKHICEP